MHKSLDESEFRPGSTTDYGVSCPGASEKFICHVLATLASSFLIDFSSFLQLTRTTFRNMATSDHELQLVAVERLKITRKS